MFVNLVLFDQRKYTEKRCRNNCKVPWVASKWSTIVHKQECSSI